jgi:hypothetical protein
MSPLLQRIMIALGRRGVQTPIDQELGNAYRALELLQERFPAVFPHAIEILIAEIEGGATGIAEIPRRLGHVAQMLDRLHREEELEAWAEEDIVIAA